MKKLIALAVAVAVVIASLFVLPTVESGPTQVLSRAGFADGDGGDY